MNDVGDPPGRIRPATAEDAEVVADIYLAARAAAVPAMPPLIHADDEVRTWVRETVLPLHDVRVAALEGMVLAMMVLYPGWLDHLYVRPELWGHGIGSSMLAEAKMLQPHGLETWVSASNAGARRFYERHGFVEVEHGDGAGNDEGEPDVLYRWVPVTTPKERA